MNMTDWLRAEDAKLERAKRRAAAFPAMLEALREAQLAVCHEYCSAGHDDTCIKASSAIRTAEEADKP